MAINMEENQRILPKKKQSMAVVNSMPDPSHIERQLEAKDDK